MRRPLTIAVAQPACVPRDPAANARLHAGAVEEAGTRLVVFPEMSLTGYHFDADPIAADDRIVLPLVTACRRQASVALVGAPIEDDDGSRYIAMLRVDGDGGTVAYRKMFLGAAERHHFDAGPEPVALDIDGWRIGLAICKDTGVLQHGAMTAALGIDVYVAGVLESADDAEVQPTRARRIVDDHGIWVAVASFAGSTGEGFGGDSMTGAAGGSAIWRPDGSCAASAGTAAGAIARATVADPSVADQQGGPLA